MKRRKIRISGRDIHYLAVFAAIATIITSTIAYQTLNPPPSERFFALWVLGSGGLAADYYPNDNPNLPIGEKVNWTVGIQNHMGSIQYVVVRVKLSNSTLASPDERTGTPSPISSIFEFTRVLVDNETWSLPFTWKILEAIPKEGNLILTKLLINESTFSGYLVNAVSGFNYRFVFELWFYDQNTKDLTFSWETQNPFHSAWIQVWFNVTETVRI